jgi:hypothetical protein
LDEEAIRMIEDHNPDIEFDWTRILKGGAEPAVERRQESRPPRQERVLEAVAPRELLATEPIPTEIPPTQPDPAAIVDELVTPAQARLGSEGLSRLRGRYAEMLARISERIQDPERQAELKTVAERLNPDAWVTEEDVLTGLDGYEATFESLRSVVGHGRRRRRRRPQAE